MRLVIQRATSASVDVDGVRVAQFEGSGLVILVGVTHDDTTATASALARKVAGLRIMRAELSVLEVSAPVLVVSQFTLYADTRKGRRPSWGGAAPGPIAEPLVAAFVQALTDLGVAVQTGVFGADMALALVNDGPVTLLLDA